MGMARASIFTALLPTKVPAAWLVSLATVTSAELFRMPRGLPTPSPPITAPVSRSSAARLNAVEKKPDMKTASSIISSVQ